MDALLSVQALHTPARTINSQTVYQGRSPRGTSLSPDPSAGLFRQRSDYVNPAKMRINSACTGISSTLSLRNMIQFMQYQC
jgi:hypothetical protein